METGKDKEERVSKGAWIAMIAIVVGLVVVATYANWQNAHRNQIEEYDCHPHCPGSFGFADTLSRVGMTQACRLRANVTH